MGPRDVARLAGASVMLPAGGFAAHCAQVPMRWGPARVVTPRLLAAARRRGLHVHVWTVDREEEMLDLLDLGIDEASIRTMIDENPRRLLGLPSAQEEAAAP